MDQVDNQIKKAKFHKWIHDKIVSGEIDNSMMVETIELLMMYLNLTPVQEWADKNNMSYQGAVKGGREVIELLGRKYIIDNE